MGILAFMKKYDTGKRAKALFLCIIEKRKVDSVCL